MIIIVFAGIIGIALGLAAILAIAFSAPSVGVAGSTDWQVGRLFISAPLPDRPRGVQEEDLPPFVFRDRPAPVHAPSSAPVRFGQPAIAVG